MAHAIAAARFPDGLVKYFLWYGTTDTVGTRLFDTVEQAWDAIEENPQTSCGCGQPEPVELYSPYAGGVYYYGTACRVCGALGVNEEDIIADSPRVWTQFGFETEWHPHEIKEERTWGQVLAEVNY